jgi:hypothetical protein
MTPCANCGGEPELITSEYHAIKANGMPAFGKNYGVGCSVCEFATRSYPTEALAVEAWEKGDCLYAYRGFHW